MWLIASVSSASSVVEGCVGRKWGQGSLGFTGFLYSPFNIGQLPRKAALDQDSCHDAGCRRHDLIIEQLMLQTYILKATCAG